MTAITTAKMFLFWMTILCLSAVIRGLHFDLKVDDDERCFLEELEDFDSMRGIYNVTYLAHNGEEIGGKMHLEVKDPEQKVILSKNYGGQGVFAFNSEVHGMYHMCFRRVADSNLGTVRINLHYEEFPRDENPESRQKEEAKVLSSAEKAVQRLIDEYLVIEQHLKKTRKREKRFRKLSETTNNRVIWWGLFQVAVLGCTSYWQMRHLTKFFIHKKLA